MTERSILAAVSGIDANQTYLDSIANNIANADTTGYKSSDVQFEDLLAEQISGASAPTSGSAGVDPVAIGSGVRVGSTDIDLTEGSLEQTGQASDVAIQGNGFLVVDSGGSQSYTRDGSLTVDGNGSLATEAGGLVMGWEANSAGVVNTNAPVTAITIPSGETIPAAATTSLTLGGNLTAWDGVGTPPVETTTINAYDGLGDTVPVTLTFTGVSGQANEWTMTGSVTTPSGGTDQLWTSSTTPTPPTLTFNPTTGQIASVNGTNESSSGAAINVPVGAMPSGYSFPSGDTWNIQFPAANSSGAVTQFSGDQTLQFQSQDGHASGTLESYSIGSDGTITGSFSDGTTLSLGQIALAGFTNPAGLTDLGGGLYSASANSGQASIGTPGSGDRGTLLGGELEQSNVDLGTELTDLITAQEAYEANTKVLTSTQQSIEALESAA